MYFVSGNGGFLVGDSSEYVLNKTYHTKKIVSASTKSLIPSLFAGNYFKSGFKKLTKALDTMNMKHFIRTYPKQLTICSI